jgi:hypothetical protein
MTKKSMSAINICQRNAEKVFRRHNIPDENQSYRKGERKPEFINKLIEEIQIENDLSGVMR